MDSDASTPVPRATRPRWTLGEVMGDPDLRHTLATRLARGVGSPAAWQPPDAFTADQTDDDVALTISGWSMRVLRWLAAT